MNAKPAARFAFRWMMAVETGDKDFFTMDAGVLDALMDVEFSHLPLDAHFHANVLDQCRQWVPTLYDDRGEAVDWEREELGSISKSGTIVTVGHREPCHRCGGEGGWNGWPGFTCYRCGGKDSRRFEWVPTKLYTKAGLDRLNKAQRRAREKAEAKAQAALQERKEAFNAWEDQSQDHQDLVTRLGAYTGSSPFLKDMARLVRQLRPLTEKQVEAALSALVQEMERAREQEQSQHVGELGERLKGLEVRILFTKTIDGPYGTSVLVGMADSQGNQLRTFATSKWVWEVSAGDTLTITGTVKKHEVYQGVHQTILTRTTKVAD